MEIRNVYNIFFSPTGGTKRVSKMLADVWSGSCTDVDITEFEKDQDTYHFAEDEAVYVSVPSYGGRVPETAVTRLGRMTGNHTPAVVIVTYGNRDYDDTLAELKQLMEAQGFCVVGAVAAVTEHSIVRQYAAGRPDAADHEALQDFGKKLMDQILTWDGTDKEITVKGTLPYKEYKGSAAKPAANQSCIGCGICAAKCPVQAIPKDHPEQTDNDSCISCMRCIQVCPQNARKIDEQILAVSAQRLSQVCSVYKENELFL